MSYADGNSTNNSRKVLTGGTVALIQAGIALALINGLAVHFIKPAPQPPLRSEQIPLPPMPQPTEQPTAKPKPAIVHEPRFDIPTPTPRIIDPVDITPQPTATPSSDASLGDTTIFIPPYRSDPAPDFTPKSAMPSNNVARWVTTDDYPTYDIRAGHTGTVRFRLSIDASGRVTDCTIVKSSGYSGLDTATCRNVTHRARFDPATDGAGKQVAGSYAGTIRWVIPQD